MCESVSFFGSAANLPHTQGAFRENIEIHESQCHNILNSISYEEAAFAEPLAVSLHACSFLDNYANKKILISGCGPIGLLILKILLQSCDQTNIFVVDVNNNVLNSAKNLGIKNIINVNGIKMVLPLTSNNSPEIIPKINTLKFEGFFSQKIRKNIQTRTENNNNDSVKIEPALKSEQKYFMKRKDEIVPLITPIKPK